MYPAIPARPKPTNFQDLLALLRSRKGSSALRETRGGGQRLAARVTVQDPEQLAREFFTGGDCYIEGEVIRTDAGDRTEVLILQS